MYNLCFYSQKFKETDMADIFLVLLDGCICYGSSW